ncbi:MAG TPA: ABC transporter permease subunit, partial [Candidatus Hodarchaeales archaeon]|nr:ABC transporter permease subunit [Candidatus Hodarchaeales archaeon]
MVYSPLDWLYRGSSNHSISRTFYFFVLAAFFLIIIVPTVFVLIYVLLQVREIQSFFMVHPEAGGIMLRALAMSFAVSIFVTIIDLVFGFILAWILAKKNFRGKNLVNTLIESPLAIPTAGLGFSAAVFWSLSPSVNFIPFGSVQIVDNVFLLIVLFHFTTTFPYVVRSLTEILEEIDKNYEIAALACGASKLTVARTITLPLFRSGVATAATLSLAKSL